MPAKQNRDRILALLGTGLLLLLLFALLPPITAWAGGPVTLLTLCGYAALLPLLHLFLFPIRYRRTMPGGAVPLPAHRLLALVGLALAALHSVGYLLLEPSSLRYLTPAAPFYMLAGLLALLLLLALVLSSSKRMRHRMSEGALGYRGPHLIGSALLLLLLSLHVCGAGLLFDSAWKMIAWSAILALAIAGLLRGGHHRPRSAP